MFGWKVAFWGAVVFVVLVCGGWFFVGTTTGTPGFVEGVQNSEECKANPDNWWCQLWGTD